MTRIPQRLGRAWREGKTDAEAHFAGYRNWRQHLTRMGIGDVTGLDILDIGCGDRAQLSLMFAAAGARVVGLDPQPIELGWRRPRMWAAELLSRPTGGLRLVARDVFHTFRYWRRLRTLSGRALPFRAVRLVRGDAAALPFPDASFDVVVSSAVWEHLPDVETASREVNRVLRPHGVAAIQIALFPALQGGHHPDWHDASLDLERSIRPWDHLRRDRVALPTYLNEWRESQYRDALERNLHVDEWEDGELRGKSFLNDSIRAELSEYDERDLLLSSVSAWARRRDD